MMKKIITLLAIIIAFQTYSFATYDTLAVSGFNADVVANGVGASAATTTNDVDGGGYAFFETGWQENGSATPATDGLPTNRIINSALTSGLQYQLADYSANNSLRIEMGDSGSLTLSDEDSAQTLYILAMSGTGSSTMNVTIDFSDGTNQIDSNINVSDWYGGSNIAYTGFMRVNITDNLTDDASNGPNLYQIPIPILSINQNKTISSVKFNHTTGSGILNIFALSVEYPFAVCSGQPSAGAINASSMSVCNTSSVTLTDTGFSHASNLTMQWQKKELTGTHAWTNLAGATDTIISYNITDSTEFRFYIVCNASSLADTSNPVTIHLNPASQCYCTPTFPAGYGCSDADEVNSFDITGDGSTSIADDNTGCSTNSYDDRTAAFSPLDLTPTNSYTASITSGTTGDNCVVWIDFNNDGIFNNTNEKVGTATSISDGTLGTNFSINIPAYADTGVHRMRVMVLFSTDPTDSTQFDACNSAQKYYGETQDYLVHILPPPSCLYPSNIHNSTITTNSATISWDSIHPMPTNGFAYYYNTTGVAPTASTPDSGVVADTSVTLSDLQPGAYYFFWVRSICSSSDTSSWSPTDNFVTQCAAVTSLPWTEGFETLPSLGNTSFPPCWYDENGDWTTIDNTDAYGVQAHTGSNFLEDDYGADSDFIWTTGYQLTAGTVYEYSFYVQDDGNSDWRVTVFQNNTQDTIGAQQLAPTFTTPGDNIYHQKKFYFTPSVSGLYFFGNSVTAGVGSDIAFDDFKLQLAPSCIPPSGVRDSLVTNNSVVLKWDSSLTNPGLGYQYHVSVTNVPPTPATLPTGSTMYTSDTLSGIPAGTKYYYWVRSICSSSDTSAWSEVDSFMTVCNPDTIPYTVPLSSATTPNLPHCTSVDAYDNTTPWFTISSPGSGFSGTTLESEGNYDDANNNWFYTNGLKLVANKIYILKFRYGTDYGTQNLEVRMGSNADTSSMVIHLVNYPSFTNEQPQWSTTYFTAPTTGTYYIGFHDYSGIYEGEIYLDSISVDFAPSCMAPQNLRDSTVTTNSAVLKWDPSLTNPGLGYQYYVSLTNIAPVASTTPTGSEMNTSAPVNGLTPSTQYYWWVRSVCDSTDTSAWSVADSFTTACVADNIPYVAPLQSAATPNLPQCMSAVAYNGTAWYTENDPGNGFNNNTLVSTYTINGTGDVNNWLYTNGLNLNANTHYVLKYRYGSNSTLPENMEVKLGMSRDTASMTTQLANYVGFANTQPTSETVGFTVPTAGVYYISFHVYSGNNEYFVFLDSVKVNICNITADSINVTSLGGNTYQFTPASPQDSSLTYNWSYSDGATSTGYSSAHVFTGGNGTYTVTLTITNGNCSVSTTKTIVITGIKDLGKLNNQLKIYPNPTRDVVNIENGSNQKVSKVVIFNSLGAMVKNVEPKNNSLIQINVSRLSFGLYSARIEFADGNMVVKRFQVSK